MKRLKYIVVAFFISLFVISCEDALESPTKSSFDESIVFSNYTLAEFNVFGLYSTFMETNAHRGRYSPYYGLNTDIEFYHSSGDPNAGIVANAKQELVTYVTTVTNTEMSRDKGPYAMIFGGIEKANVVISGLKTYGNIDEDAEMAYLLGEAITLRATLYFDLLRAWSDVPARFEPLTGETIYLQKTDRDEIYKKLISDLQEAEKYVPWPNEVEQTSTVERINKAYVKGLLARICLSAAGYAQRPVELNSGSGQSEISLSKDPKLDKKVLYPIALKACEDVYENGSSMLMPNFIDIWKYNLADGVEAGKESLFEIPYSDTRGRWMYSWAVPHLTVDKYTESTAGGSGGPVPNLFYDYDVDDTRRDVTCVPYNWNNGVQEISGLNKWFFGKYRFEWMARMPSSSTDHGINTVYMRYSDVLLMAAECANDLDDLPKAKKYLRMVRERAFPNHKNKVDAFMESITDKTKMFDAIVNERAFEFCGEFLRKNDLIRWNKLGAKMQEAKDKMTNLANLSGEYSDLQSKLFFKYGEDEETLEFYGLNHGELSDPGEGWNSVTYISPTKLTPEKINGLFWDDPDKMQFWPLFQKDIDASAGYLINDYAY
ncbi:MAG: RagB/SusD family nutrient uptake outer membrane protein [Marinilabiliaceae bacterium]|nr:RagB/SusD family nutrient uptake outer membrane protein [Marinilabiliaceae bacterium]